MFQQFSIDFSLFRLCAYLVLTAVKFFEMLWLLAKLDLFSVHVVVYIHLCSNAQCVIGQTGREGGTDKEREKNRGGGSLEASTSATLSVALTPCSIRTGCLTCCDWWPQLWTGPRWGRQEGGLFGREVDWVGDVAVVWGMDVKEWSWWTWLVAPVLRELCVDPEERRR